MLVRIPESLVYQHNKPLKMMSQIWHGNTRCQPTEVVTQTPKAILILSGSSIQSTWVSDPKKVPEFQGPLSLSQNSTPSSAPSRWHDANFTQNVWQERVIKTTQWQEIIQIQLGCEWRRTPVCLQFSCTKNINDFDYHHLTTISPYVQLRHNHGKNNNGTCSCSSQSQT